MKTLTAMLLVLISLSVGSTYHDNLNQVSSNTLDQTVTQSHQTTHDYIITQVNGNEYYGQSTTDDTGIYFTYDNISFTGTVEEGDTIQGVYDQYNELVRVDNVNAEQKQ